MEEYEEKQSNVVRLVGAVASEFAYDHELYGEKYYQITLAVNRDSGKVDTIPVLISDRLINVRENYIGKCIYIKGQFRSYNQHEGDRSRVKLYVFALAVEMLEEQKSYNDIFLEGYLCKPPIYRLTPMGREITDLMLAVNRSYNKSDYIPCICWGRNAYYSSHLVAGDLVRLAGRIQSREYNKDGVVKVAYELSVNIIEKV